MTFTPTTTAMTVTTTSAVRASKVRRISLQKPARGSSAHRVRANFETTIIIRIPRCMYISCGERSYTELPTLIKPVQVQTPRLRALHIVTAAINNHYIRRAVLPHTRSTRRLVIYLLASIPEDERIEVRHLKLMGILIVLFSRVIPEY